MRCLALRITDKMQQVAADILTRLYFVNDIDEVIKIVKEMEEKYELCDDPFTHTPCTTKEYYENIKEYERQVMEERFGYYE